MLSYLWNGFIPLPPPHPLKKRIEIQKKTSKQFFNLVPSILVYILLSEQKLRVHYCYLGYSKIIWDPMRNVDVTEWYYGELETSTFMSSVISNPFSHSLGQQENGNQPYWRSVMVNCYNAAKRSFLLTHWCSGVWILIHKIELIVLRLLVWIVFEYLFLSFSSSPLTVTKTAELSN